MNRGKSRTSDGEEPSEDSLFEAELAQFQRKYRVMQNDYRAYREETKRIINKQSSLMDGLIRERIELDTWMSKMETTQNKMTDENNAQRLRELSHDAHTYYIEILEESKKCKELDQQILQVEKKIAKQRKNMGGTNNSTNRFISMGKKQAVLENRLDKAMVHFNNQLAINTRLRSDIDHLRQERCVFDNLYKKLAKELQKCKQDMAEVIESSTQAFEQRDEAQNKMDALMERNEKDQQQHDVEMKELQRIIIYDNKIKEFMHIKSSDRAELKAEENEKKIKMRGDKDGANSELAIIQNYEEAFAGIREVTGEEDIDTIVKNFIRDEDENFALFNYVNELNSEVESLQEQVVAIKKDIEKFRDEEAQLASNHNNVMKTIENNVSKAKDCRMQSENQLKDVNQSLDRIFSGITTIFQTIGCDMRPIQEILGDPNINTKNAMIYLGLIEQKTSELLNIMHYIETKKSELEGVAPPAPPASAMIPAGTPRPLTVLPPVNADDEGDEDEAEDADIDEVVLSEDELRARVLRSISKKAQADRLGPQTKQTPDLKEKSKKKKRQAPKTAS